MTRLKVTVLLLATSVSAMAGQQKPATAELPDLGGTWTLNRALSQFPREVGFGMDVVPSGRTASDELAGVAGEGRSGNPRSLTEKPQTEDVARNTRQLIDEIKTPSARLTIAQTGTAVTVTDARGRSRTFHPDGRDELQSLDAGPMATTTRWDGARLIVRYKVEPGRDIRYTYARKSDPPQLIVQTELLERGGHDTVVRVYEPGSAATPAESLPDAAAPSSFPMLPSQRTAARPSVPAMADPGRATVPAMPERAASAPMDQRPDAELMGLTAMGVVVEGLGPEAARCGLKQDAVESAVTKSLSDAGLKVARNSDEDTYLYVHVITTAMSTGFCFSRYDATVYSYATTTMSYGSRPVIAQVSLMHKGGITGSGVSGHGEAVARTLTEYVSQFATKIRAANR